MSESQDVQTNETDGENSMSTFVPFDWDGYLKGCDDAKAAPAECFYQTEVAPINEFRENHLLLAQDKHAADLMVLCKVRVVHKCWIYIHIEGLDDTHCRWLMCNDRGIAPVGPFDPSSKVDNRNAFPPTGLKPTFKKWIAQQFHGNEDNIAPADIFKPISSTFRPKGNRFEVGMKLAAYDEKSFDGKLSPATVVDVEKNSIKVNFDGWPSSFDVLVSYDARNIYPIQFTNPSEIEVNVPRTISIVTSGRTKVVSPETHPKKSPRVSSRTSVAKVRHSPSPSMSPHSSRSATSQSVETSASSIFSPSEPAVKRKRSNFYQKPMRPGQRAAAMYEQRTGVKAKVIDILRSAAEEAEKCVPEQDNIATILSEHPRPEVSQLRPIKPRPPGVITNINPQTNRVIPRPPPLPFRTLAPRPPPPALPKQHAPATATVHPSLRTCQKYKLVPVSQITLENISSGSQSATISDDIVYPASGIAPVPRIMRPSDPKRLELNPSASKPVYRDKDVHYEIVRNPGSPLLTASPVPWPLTSVPKTTHLATEVPPSETRINVKRELPGPESQRASCLVVKEEPIETITKSILTHRKDRLCGAFVDRTCRVGPLLEKSKVHALGPYLPRHYVLLQQAIVQDLINCAWVPKEVFDLVQGTVKEPYHKVIVDDEGVIRTKKIPIFMSVATTWMYLKDLMTAINCCPKLISSNEFSCDSCSASTSEPPPELGDDGLPKTRTIKCKREIDVLRKLGAKLYNVEEITEEFRRRLGDEVADIIMQNEIDSAVLPFCQEDVLREHMKLPYHIALKIAGVACELRALAFQSVPGIEHMELQL